MPGRKSRQKAVPGGRASRLTGMVKLASGVAGGMLAEGGRRLSRGERPSARDMLLTPGNARRVSDELANLRGAAMKVGQMLSMDAGDILPAELTDILARLRSDAHYMPVKQLRKVMQDNYGPDWEDRFYQFDTKPVAAASIGQVHKVVDAGGRQLALKVQYPGVKQSIDSDVDNVATLLRLSGLLPKNFDIATILEEAKLQLHQEADYSLEADYLRRYSGLLAGNPHFALPELAEDYSTDSILAMSFMNGDSIETLAQESLEDRSLVVTRLLELLFRELFEFRLVQTDPNFANYQYQPGSGKLVLLDFGACRDYPQRVSRAYRAFFKAAMAEDRKALAAAAAKIGYFGENIGAAQKDVVLDLFLLATEPMRWDGPYDFGSTDLTVRLSDAGMQMSLDQDLWHTPPTDALLLHRKLGGLLMLASRMEARIDIGALLRPHL